MRGDGQGRRDSLQGLGVDIAGCPLVQPAVPSPDAVATACPGVALPAAAGEDAALAYAPPRGGFGVHVALRACA
jgi:hypothetical protein